MKFYAYIFVITIILLGCQNRSFRTIYPNNDHLKYVGRINFDNSNSPIVYWSGSGVTMNFTGSSVSAILSDEKGLNYFNVIIDNKPEYALKLEEGEKNYLLADSLSPDSVHTISLLKRNEWNTGSTQFKGFCIGNGKISKASKTNNRLIEFYGNSITAGYAIEDTTDKDRPDSTFTNNYKSYAALTARYFNADLHCIVRSGIGIQVSWERPIMPEIYNLTNPIDSASIWDFSKVEPNIVVINLMQNDSWLVNMPYHHEFKYRFGDQKPSEEQIIGSYASFISKIRNAYPNTHIICVLGSMEAVTDGSPWPGYIVKATDLLNDKKVYTHFFPHLVKNKHPGIEENKKMAASLISFIEENVDW